MVKYEDILLSPEATLSSLQKNIGVDSDSVIGLPDRGVKAVDSNVTTDMYRDKYLQKTHMQSYNADDINFIVDKLDNDAANRLTYSTTSPATCVPHGK